MQYAMTTDYVSSEGDPAESLRRVAEAGWAWLPWCHHWDDDFLYGPAELRQLEIWLRDLHLRVLDIHGSAGREKGWDALEKYQREAGVELVRNRIEMADRLGCRVVIMHPARGQGAADATAAARRDSLRRSLDALLPDLRRHHVRLAMENMRAGGFDELAALLAEYPPDLLGLCYDSGHGLLSGDGLERLEPLADRLIALHLNDNDGREDLHLPPFAGRVDWPRLARMVRRSGYDREAISLEVVLRHSGTADEGEFLRRCAEAARRFDALLAGV